MDHFPSGVLDQFPSGLPKNVRYADLGAKISWFRSGYLALVAMYGYELAFDPAMEIVRRQIIECDERKMVTFTSVLPQDYPFTRRVIAKVLEPESHGGWAVLFGRYVLTTRPRAIRRSLSGWLNRRTDART